MSRIRRVSFGVTFILGSVFCFEQMAFMLVDDSKRNYIYAIVDYDNSTEQGDDKKEENKLKEYKIQEYHRIHLASLYLSNCAKYGQLSMNLNKKVFLDVVTPPPEA